MRRQICHRLSLMVVAVLISMSSLAVSSVSAAAPTIVKTGVSEVTTTSATLEAEINPQGKVTKYRFEYGTADCSVNPCTKTFEGKIPAGSSPVVVKVKLEGLTLGTIYHLRVVVKNGETINGSDRIFATYSVFDGLSDNRFYEQASPVNKDG